MKCKSCDKDYNFLNGYRGECDNCHNPSVSQEIEQAKAAGLSLYEFRKRGGKTEKEYRVTKIAEKIADDNEAAKLASFILTTETSHNLPVTERLGIVTAEAVLGMNAFKDIMSDIRGAVGGRSKTLEKGLRDAREICLTDLKRDAIKLGADAVVGVHLAYQDIGSTGKMLMVVATGTAIKL